MMIIFIAVSSILVVLVVRWLGAGGNGLGGHLNTPPGKIPVDILKERLARGEIDKEEFEEHRRILSE